MNTLESRIKGLEQHIEKLYETIEGWENIVKEKDDIIKKYEMNQHRKIEIITPDDLAAVETKIVQELKGLKSHINEKWPEIPPEYLTRKEAADFLKVTKKTLDELTKKKLLERHKIGGGIRYKRVELVKAVENP